MASNLDINQELITQAMKAGNFKTKKKAVNKALSYFVKYLKRNGIKELQGKIDFYDDYDYKKNRNR